MTTFVTLGLALICCLGFTQANPLKARANEVATEFIILHNNDMHARFEQTSVDSGKCTEEMANSNKCYGGFARVAYEVRKYREEANKGGTPVLYLNAGDTYTGTAWFYVFKDEIASAFLNKLKPDAISLGNHEFDEDIEGLVPFLNKVEFPVLTANMDLSEEPDLRNAKNLHNSTVLEVNGVKIGVIGYLTPDTQNLTRSKGLKFVDEIESINRESALLKAEGINIIIALGHSGYMKDQEIAAKCPDVDLVIGGHSHSFLYTGDAPDAERIEGPYPTIVNRTNGLQVPVVQAYAYTKYLGKLHVQFDKDGNLIEFDGTPILLNAEVPREDDVLQLLEFYRPNVTALENDVIGHTKVHLEGRSEICRSVECNLGNLVADSMVHARVLEDMGGTYWTDASVAFVQGGGIRNSIEKRSDGSILAADAVGVLPFDNDLFVTKISGKTIWAALEHSATMFERDSSGGFLQMSGVHTTYDYNKPAGNRVVSVDILCAACNVPSYEALDENKLYNVIVPRFLLEGGDGHKFVEDNGSEHQLMQKTDAEAFKDYLKKRDFVYPEIEERITIIQKEDDGEGSGEGNGEGNGEGSGEGNGGGDGAFAVVSSGLLVVLSMLTLAWTH